MGKNIIYKCPNCGASLEISDQIDTFFCTYCGLKMYSGDPNRIRAQYGVKKMDHELDMLKEKTKNDRLAILVGFPLMFFIILVIGIMVISGNITEREKAKENIGKIQLKQSSGDMEGENFRDVYDLLTDNGFTNIKPIEMNKKAPEGHNPGEVERVVIGGGTDYYINDFFTPDVPIKIYYYNLEE